MLVLVGSWEERRDKRRDKKKYQRQLFVQKKDSLYLVYLCSTINTFSTNKKQKTKNKNLTLVANDARNAGRLPLVLTNGTCLACQLCALLSEPTAWALLAAPVLRVLALVLSCLALFACGALSGLVSPGGAPSARGRVGRRLGKAVRADGAQRSADVGSKVAGAAADAAPENAGSTAGVAADCQCWQLAMSPAALTSRTANRTVSRAGRCADRRWRCTEEDDSG